MDNLPPDTVQAFFDHMRSLDMASVARLQEYVDPRASKSATPSGLLRKSSEKTSELQERYFEIQQLFFDYVGRCHMCNQTTKHVHGIQASGVREVEGFPGLFIYPKLLSNHLVHKKIIDDLLHRKLSDSRNITNVHADYHTTGSARTGGLANTVSIFESALPGQSMESNLLDPWVGFAITVKTFLSKLRWLSTRHQSDEKTGLALDTALGTLVGGILPMQPKTETAYFSSSEVPLELREIDTQRSAVLNISLGCSGMVTVAMPARPSGNKHNEAHKTAGQLADESFGDLIAGYSSDEEDDTIVEHSSEHRVIAIHLRSTDAVLFTGASLQAWYGVAKVEAGSAPVWEEQWPEWFEKADTAHLHPWKGIMKARRIDLTIS